MECSTAEVPTGALRFRSEAAPRASLHPASPRSHMLAFHSPTGLLEAPRSAGSAPKEG
jgi:hypothetical protein